jgi:hypothetical protein
MEASWPCRAADGRPGHLASHRQDLPDRVLGAGPFATRVLVGVVRQLMAQHQRQLIVVEGRHEPGKHPHRAVGHGRGVPVLRFDHVHPDGLLRDVARAEAVHDAVGTIDLGPTRQDVADLLDLVTVDRLEHHLVVDPELLDLVGDVDDLTLVALELVGPASIFVAMMTLSGRRFPSALVQYPGLISARLFTPLNFVAPSATTGCPSM